MKHESVFLNGGFSMADKIKKEKKVKEKKKETKVKKESYGKQLRKELKLVKWPSAKEVVKYSISTIIFCLVICAFFLLLNYGLALIKELFIRG